MIRQKKGFLTFIFSLLPGAGEMYMGFFKQGISIMLAFFGIIAISSLAGLNAAVILVPIVWFYSFFHVHNLASMPFELFRTMEDHYLFTENDEQLKTTMQSNKARKVLAIALIVIGVSSIWDILTDQIYRIFPESASETISNVTHMVPQCLIAILIIYLGVILIRGKKKELDTAQEDSVARDSSNQALEQDIIDIQVDKTEEVK